MQIENTTLPPRRDMVVMRKRPLGETGIDVPWVGLGAKALGYRGTGSLIDSVVNSVKRGIVPDADAVHLIRNALDMQSNLIDTAPYWGQGRAERLVGQAIEDRRGGAVVVAKVGRDAKGHIDFSPKALEESFGASLQRLHSDYIDVLLLDCPDAALLDASHEVWAWMKELKKQGAIRAYGAKVEPENLAAAAEKSPAQVLQSRFSIFHQQAKAAFDAIQTKRIGFIATAPLDGGFLGGRYGRFSVFFDWRKRWSRADVWRRGELRDKVEALRPATVSLAQFALQFVLAHPAVSCAVAGAKEQQQLIYNVDTVGGEISDESVKALETLWADEIEHSPLPR